jgi:hypothetical protein
MPTPTGKPKAGERITWRGNDGSVRHGTVTQRTSGEYYSLYILWDGTSQPKLVVDAPFWLSRGNLRVD